MQQKRRRLVPLLVFVAVVGAVGYIWWLTSPREFRGTLRREPHMIGTPEDPPPLAYLVTEDGTHELDIPRHMADRAVVRRLEEMNGKQVVVREKWGVRRTLAREHRAICVEELRLCE